MFLHRKIAKTPSETSEDNWVCPRGLRPGLRRPQCRVEDVVPVTGVRGALVAVEVLDFDVLSKSMTVTRKPTSKSQSWYRVVLDTRKLWSMVQSCFGYRVLNFDVEVTVMVQSFCWILSSS